MQIVVTTFLDQLYELIVQGPRLVSLYEQKDISFIPSFKSWLESIETVLKNNHRPQVGEIAGIRAQLIAAENGVYDTNSFSKSSAPGTRKMLYASAALKFNNAQNILKNLHSTFSTYRDEAQKYMRQILLISLQKNTFYPAWNGTAGITDKLNNLWLSFSADKDLVQGVRQILSLVNYLDALRILDETITEWKL